MLSKTLVQFSVDRWVCFPSLLFDLRPNYGGGNEDNCHLLQKCPMQALLHQCQRPHRSTLLTSTGDSWTITDKSGKSLLGSLLLSPGSWCIQGFVCALQESVSPVLCKFCNQTPLASKVKLPGDSYSLWPILRLENLL